MKRFLAICLAASMSITATLSAFGADEYGGTIAIDFEDLVDEILDEQPTDEIDSDVDNEDSIGDESDETVGTDDSENVEIPSEDDNSTEDNTETEEPVEDTSEALPPASIDDGTEQVTIEDNSDEFLEDMTNLNQEIDNNRNNSGSGSGAKTEINTVENVVEGSTETTSVETSTETVSEDNSETTTANYDIMPFALDELSDTLLHAGETYEWDLTTDKSEGDNDFGLFYKKAFVIGGGATITKEDDTVVKYTNSIVATTNGSNGGITFTAPVSGTMTVAYKVNNNKSYNIFGKTGKNTSGSTRYYIDTVNFNANQKEELYLDGSKIQIYYLGFTADEDVVDGDIGKSENFKIPDGAVIWDVSTSIPQGNWEGFNADGSLSQTLVSGEPMTAHVSSGFTYAQGTNNPVIKNRIPQSGAYITFTPTEDGVFYVEGGVASGRKYNICNYEYQNTTSSDEIVQQGYEVKAGKTYYVYSLSSKMKFVRFGFMPGLTAADSTEYTPINAPKDAEGIFTVEYADGTKTECFSWKDAITTANHHTATIWLNDNYYIDANDIDTTNPDFSQYGTDIIACPYLEGSDTVVTLESAGNARRSLVRDTSNYEYKPNDWTSVKLKNFISLRDHATFSIGVDGGNGVILDGGFKFDSIDRKLSPTINGTNMANEFGPLIYVSDGSTLNLNTRSILSRNYFCRSEGYISRYAVIDTIKSSTTDSTYKGDQSNVYFNGGSLTQNYGQGLVCANNGLKVTLEKADIYYNESINRAEWSDGLSGALKLEDSADNLVFTDNCDVQIRSNQHYESTGDVSESLADIMSITDINLSGRCEIGELAMSNYTNNINSLKTDKHKNTITVWFNGYSLNTAVNGSAFKINVTRTDAETEATFNPYIIVKVIGTTENNDKASSQKESLYYKIFSKKDAVDADDGYKTTTFTDIYRDSMIYRANKDIGEDTARYGMVLTGAFKWGYSESSAQQAQQAKYDLIGFDVAVQEDKPDENSAYKYISTDTAYYKGIYWNNYPFEEHDEESTDFTIVNPITGTSVGGNYSQELNGDVDRYTDLGNDGWASQACAKFGVEVRNIPGNTRIWVRKRFVLAGEDAKNIITTDQNPDALVGEWISLDTPSLYTVALFSRAAGMPVV